MTGGDKGGVEDVADIEATGAAIEPRVEAVFHGRGGDIAGVVGNGEALGPGVVGEEAEVVGHAVLDGSDDSAVGGVVAVADHGHGRAVGLSLRRVSQREHGAEVGVACRRAGLAHAG